MFAGILCPPSDLLHKEITLQDLLCPIPCLRNHSPGPAVSHALPQETPPGVSVLENVFLKTPVPTLHVRLAQIKPLIYKMATVHKDHNTEVLQKSKQHFRV